MKSFYLHSCLFKRCGGSISVVLLKELAGKGKTGETIKVKGGYARNYLIPRKIATYTIQEFQNPADTQSKITNIQIQRHIKPNGRLIKPIFGYDIKQHLRFVHRIPVKHVDLVKPIKELGLYDVKYDRDIVRVEVVKEDKY